MPYFAIPEFLPGNHPDLLAWFTSSILFNFLYGSMFLYAYKKLSDTRIQWWQYLVVGFIYSFAITIVGTTLAIVITSAMLYFFTIKRQSSFSSVASQFFYINFITNWLFGMVGMTVTTIYYRLLTPNTYYQFSFYVLSYVRLLCSLLVILLVVRYTKKLIKNYDKFVVSQIPLIAWGFNSLVIVSLYYLYAIQYKDIVITYYTFIIIGIILLALGHWLIAHMTNYYRYKTQSYNVANEIEQLEEYVSQVEVMYDDVRRFRHDYKNILYSLSTAIESNNIELIREKYDSLIMPTQKEVTSQTSAVTNLKNLQNIEFKSILYSKIMAAIDEGVNFEIEIEQPIKIASEIDIVDAVRIVSILLDNAIAAAKRSSKKIVNFSFFEMNDQQYLIVGNSTLEDRVDLSKISQRQNELSVFNAHGTGLRNLRLLLARYPNVQNNQRVKDHWFEQELIIPTR